MKLTPPSEEVVAFLADVVGAVEANGFESQMIWQEYTRELKKPWVDARHGYGATVGYLDGRPVCISLLTPIVDGHRILFWYATSQVVDYSMIEAWLEKYLPRSAFDGNRPNRADAMNFCNVLHTAGRLALSSVREKPMSAPRQAKVERWRFPDGSVKQVALPFYPASCDNCGWQGSSEKCGTDTTGDDSDVYCPACGQSGCDTGTAAEAAVRVRP